MSSSELARMRTLGVGWFSRDVTLTSLGYRTPYMQPGAIYAVNLKQARGTWTKAVVYAKSLTKGILVQFQRTTSTTTYRGLLIDDDVEILSMSNAYGLRRYVPPGYYTEATFIERILKLKGAQYATDIDGIIAVLQSLDLTLRNPDTYDRIRAAELKRMPEAGGQVGKTNPEKLYENYFIYDENKKVY